MPPLKKSEEGLVKLSENYSVNPQFLSQEGLQSAQSFASQTPIISSESLAQTQPMNLASAPVSTTASSVVAQSGNLAELNQDVATKQAESQASLGEVTNLMTQIGGQRAEGLSLAESSGLNEKNKQIAENNAEILALRNATNQEKERLGKVPGMTQVGLRGIYNDIDTRNAFKITNLEMQNAFTSINANSLMKSIETQLALKYEPLETQLQIAQMNYQNNKDLFNKAEQRQFETAQFERNAQLNQQKQDDERKYDLLNVALDRGIQLPADIISYANKEGVTAQDLQAKMAQRGISLAKPEDPLDRQLKQAQLAKLRAPGGGGGDGVSSEKPMSIGQIEQFRRSYGWTPPFGFTLPQLNQYIADNPNATKEELQAGANSIGGVGVTGEQKEKDEKAIRDQLSTVELKKLSDWAGTSRWWRHKTRDVNDFFKRADEAQLSQIKSAIDFGYPIEEIISFLK